MSDTKSPQFLLLMPRSEEFTRLRRLISSSLEEVGIKPILPEETILPGDPINSSIHGAIERADAVIVDITGSNPNLMFEAGFASGLGKPLLPLVQRGVERVPSDISGRLYLVYDPSDPGKLYNNIKNWALLYLKNKRASA
jgi:nucleoside 2-deoxyribosyltransferase